MNKEFDSVEMQRKIRDEFIEEADNDFDKLLSLLKKKISESDINKKLIERKEKQLTTV
ncbi:MAG: hypothetical protein WCR42_02295 [bacterium]